PLVLPLGVGPGVGQHVQPNRADVLKSHRSDLGVAIELVVIADPRHQRAPLRALHEVHSTCRFAGSSVPPLLRGWMWSISNPRYTTRPFLAGTGSPGCHPQARHRL